MASRDHSGRGHGQGWLWAFVDVLLVLTFVQSAFIFLALPQINPPAEDTPQIKPPGNIAVLVCWPEGNTDVDLWATAPGEPVPVGYSNKSGRVWSLLRDDMGEVNDDGPTNCESMFARATPAGEYAINVHGYSLPFGPVTVHVEIAINGRLLMSRNMELQPKQERTVLAWKMNEAGTVVSHDEVYRPLRSATK